MRRVVTVLKRVLQLLVFLVAAFLVFGAWAYRDVKPDIGPEVQFVDLEGATIAYRIDGFEHATETPVVMIHAMFYHMGLWDDWAEEMSKTRPVYRFDVAGHGLSSRHEKDDYSLQATMDTLEAFMELHKLDKVVLVGASMGGATAFNYAAARPEKIEKLVLVNAGGLEGHDEAGSAGVPGWAYWILRYLPNRTLDKFVNWTAANNDTGDAFREDFRTKFRAPGTRKGILGRMSDFKSPDTKTVLPKIVAPTLVMWGEDNPQLPVHQAHDFAKLLRQGPALVQLKIYPRAGHILPAENVPDALADLTTFLDEPVL